MAFANTRHSAREARDFGPTENGQAARPSTGLHKPFIIWEIATLLLLVSLSLVVHFVRGPLPGDVELELSLQHAILPNTFLTKIIEFASTINWPNQALYGVVGILVGLLLLRRWAGAFAAGCISGLGDASSYLTNQLVQRPRPQGHDITILQQINTYFSFPSGHVVHVIAFFGFILFLTFQTEKLHQWWLWIIRLPLIALLVSIAPSRVLEGEHWPSDVMGGLLLGSFWLVAGIHFYHWLHRRSPLRHLKPFSSRDETFHLDRTK